MVLELGVPADEAMALIAELEPPPGIGECGLLMRLKAGSAPAEPARALGWEVLGVEWGGSFHSWLCNALHKAANDQLNLRPGHLQCIGKCKHHLKA